MLSCAATESDKNITSFLLAVSVEIFTARQLPAEFELSLLKMKRFFGRAGQTEATLSRKIVGVQNTKMEGHKKQKLFSHIWDQRFLFFERRVRNRSANFPRPQL